MAVEGVPSAHVEEVAEEVPSERAPVVAAVALEPDEQVPQVEEVLLVAAALPVEGQALRCLYEVSSPRE